MQPLKLFLILLTLVLVTTDADAARRKKGGRHHNRHVIQEPMRERDAAIVIDASNGKVLYERLADEPRYPASLTKMMTLYMLFEALQKGDVSLSTRMTTSPYASSQDPTKLGLEAGDTLTVEEAIKALIVRSANDAAVVVAEYLGGGSEDRFAAKMTAKARELGMAHTTYRNASGLPDKQQETTARDLVLLGRRLITDFPQFYPYFNAQSFVWNDKTFDGHNNLLKYFDGADGLKTGYTRLSGFNLTTSATRRGVRLIGVVMGGQSARARDVQMAEMLEGEFTKLGLGRPAPVIVAMSPLVPDDDEAIAAQETEQAVDTRPEEEEVTTQPVSVPVTPVPAGPSAGPMMSPVVPDTNANVITPSPKPVYASLGQNSRPEAQGDTDDQRGRSEKWGIQVGAYSDEGQAKDQLRLVLRKADDLIGNAQNAIVALDVRGEKFYRVRFGSFTPSKAEELCKRLQSRGVSCLMVTDAKWDNATSRAVLPVALR